MNFFGIFSGRAVDRDVNRKMKERCGVFGRLFLVSGSLLVAACQTVGLPAPPITVTTVAVPVDETGDTAPRLSSPRVSETRGLWVIRSTLVHPDSVRAMVARAADAGFNTLLVQVRGRGDATTWGASSPERKGSRAGRPSIRLPWPSERHTRGASRSTLG